jgi:hypothetical protein
MTLISSNNDEALGISPLKTTLFLIIQIHQVIANLIKQRTHLSLKFKNIFTQMKINIVHIRPNICFLQNSTESIF